ncbi:DUF3592 domain-containing protein [Inquilinus sp.]|jgi:hypothetical protein|uniref:DUF3592 domain-containing protein n=1 Tax=Inquilinus sp. TaxID=1932117 RepID=UPI0037844FC0
MSSVLHPDGAPRRRKSPWRIVWDSGLVFGLALLLGSGFVASALLPGAPDSMAVFTQPIGGRGSWAASGAIVLPISLMVVWYGGRHAVRQWRLVRHGVRVIGRVARTEPFVTAAPNPPKPGALFKIRPEYGVHVHYRFRDETGREHEGRSKPKVLWPRPAPGDPIAVVYDPRRPGNSVPEADLVV